MQQIFQLAYFSFIAAIMIIDRFPKFDWAKRDAWRGFTGNGKKSLSLARLVKSKSSIALFFRQWSKRCQNFLGHC